MNSIRAIYLEKHKFIQGNCNHRLFKSQATQLPHLSHLKLEVVSKNLRRNSENILVG